MRKVIFLCFSLFQLGCEHNYDKQTLDLQISACDTAAYELCVGCNGDRDPSLFFSCYYRTDFECLHSLLPPKYKNPDCLSKFIQGTCDLDKIPECN